MNRKKIVHILIPDKFTIPFIQFINKEFHPEDHLFLCVIKPGEEPKYSNRNVRYLYIPRKKFWIKNSLTFYRTTLHASKIILHGIPVLIYFIFFPRVLSKTYWIIQGYELGIPGDPRSELPISFIDKFLKHFLLKRVHGHISQIKGDSEYANKRFKSSAIYYYSPVYLSNVVSNKERNEKKSWTKDRNIRILVGNSTSPTNNHLEIFKMILPYKDENIIVYSPLSYGSFYKYRDAIIKEGKNLFGEKFIPMTEFLKPDEYTSFLEGIDVAIFNHKRQEGMGVTLELLNMGKTVYLNSCTTTYSSLIERGIHVFDNSLIEKDGLFKDRDVSGNPDLLYKNYSYQKLIDSLSFIFKS